MELSRELLLTVLENVDVGIYLLDNQGNFLFVNRAFAEMTGFGKEGFQGVNVLRKSPHYQGSVSEIVYREKKKVVLFQDMTFLNRPSAQPRQFRMITSSTPIFDGTGQVKNIVATCEPFYLLNGKYQAARSGQVSALTFSRQSPPLVKPVIQSPAMRELYALLAQVAGTDSTVLLLGESGVGKDVCAAYLHDQSPRRESPLIEVNCASLPENLLESELFGYVKGAFTGALASGKQGYLFAAAGGTVFLNEINSMPLGLQGKLLRVLESKRVRPIGATSEQPVDFRLVCAANEDLETLCRQGKFRWDLYYRIGVVPVRIPPLRERPEEILPLAETFLREFCNQYGKERCLAPQVREQLLRHSWPGNVRELRNLMERLVVTSQEGVTDIFQLPEDFFHGELSVPTGDLGELIVLDTRWGLKRLTAADFSLQGYLDACEKELLKTVLQNCASTYQAARLLKVSQPTVVRRKQKYHLYP